MPIYEYQCDSCGQRFERQQRMSDPPISDCPSCDQGDVRRLISASAFQFKGSGWYVTDYSRASKPAGDAGASNKAAGDKAAAAD